MYKTYVLFSSGSGWGSFTGSGTSESESLESSESESWTSILNCSSAKVESFLKLKVQLEDNDLVLGFRNKIFAKNPRKMKNFRPKSRKQGIYNFGFSENFIIIGTSTVVDSNKH